MDKKQPIYENELFWINHPSLYVSMYVKPDFLKLSRVDFLLKYLKKYEVEQCKKRKKLLKKLLFPMYKDFTGKSYKKINL